MMRYLGPFGARIVVRECFRVSGLIGFSVRFGDARDQSRNAFGASANDSISRVMMYSFGLSGLILHAWSYSIRS